MLVCLVNCICVTVRTKAGPTWGPVDLTRPRAGLVSGQSSFPAVLWARPRGQLGATVDVKTCYGTVDGVSSSYVDMVCCHII